MDRVKTNTNYKGKMDRFFNPTSRHLDLLPVIHHAIWQRYELGDTSGDTVTYPQLNQEKLEQLAEVHKDILVDKPGEEHLYMEAVIVDYGKFLATS